MAILAAWSLLHTRMLADGIATRPVIQSNTMDDDRAMAGDFTARSALAEPDPWPRFVRTLARMGRARLRVSAVLACDGEVARRSSGAFVALVVPEAKG